MALFGPKWFTRWAKSLLGESSTWARDRSCLPASIRSCRSSSPAFEGPALATKPLASSCTFRALLSLPRGVVRERRAGGSRASSGPGGSLNPPRRPTLSVQSDGHAPWSGPAVRPPRPLQVWTKCPENALESRFRPPRYGRLSCAVPLARLGRLPKAARQAVRAPKRPRRAPSPRGHLALETHALSAGASAAQQVRGAVATYQSLQHIVVLVGDSEHIGQSGLELFVVQMVGQDGGREPQGVIIEEAE